MANLSLDFGPTLPVGPQVTVLRNVFLAGKITGNPWREQLVHGSLALPVVTGYTCALDSLARHERLRYPVLERA